MKYIPYPATKTVYQNAEFSTCYSWWTHANDKTRISSYQFQIIQCSRQFSIFTVLILSISIILTLCLVVVVCIWMKRRRTYQKLVDCGLPTVFWSPKFVNYVYPGDASNANGSHVQHSKLPSTSITGIRPRMKRLDGPYGMYGTVYGVSTSVVHVAHPVPAVTILSTIPKIPDPPSRQNNNTRPTSISLSCAATKEPAYDHFKNFCGEGVFTADGEDWKIKRAAVMHALLRGVGEPGGYQTKIEQLSNVAANQLIQDIETYTRKLNPCDNQTVDIVPILQRATIGLIYRYITHTDLVMGPDKKDAFDTQKASTSSSPTKVPEKLFTTKHKDVELISNYLKSITRIRMIILAQSRSIWFLLPRWMYRALSDLYQQEEATSKASLLKCT
jgi:Cytochrome P450